MASDCICILLRTVSRKVTALYDEALAPHGITVAQYSLLRRIRKAEQPSLTELARLTELDRSTIGRNVRLLEQVGLVTLDVGIDQREAKVRLTERARTTIEACEGPWREAQRTVESGIGPEGLNSLKEFVGSL